MSTHVIRNDADRKMFARLLESRDLPVTVSIAKGAKRSEEQNRLQRQWLREAAEQLQDDSAEGYRAYCKLTMGVPILRADNEEFAQQYDRIVKPLPYEQKLELMREPIDFPVTRLMTTRQKKDYLDQMWTHFTSLGVALTDPDAIQWRAA